jgi:N-methylhydantoinase B/oxoprolinase/acetone carboxylase alpha subunit
MIDSITLNVINNFLTNTCREMGMAMMKTSYSSIFNEGLDFSCVIFDAQGELIAQAEFNPAQLGAIKYTVSWTLEEIGLNTLNPGDVVIHNDPYKGGCHLPEHTVVKPVYFNNELFGFVANIAHITEIGGKAPGGFAADATEIYQEGLRIPPIKIMRGGKHVRDVWKLIMSNHRTPSMTWGDLHAMIGSLTIAEKRLMELVDRYGIATINDATKELLDYSERCMRGEIRELPDGESSFEDYIANDGVVQNKSYKIKVTIVVSDDEMIVDYTGSDKQAMGPINCTYGVTASATYNAVFNVTNPEIPHNSGCYRPIHIIAPAGTVVNVTHPAPEVGGNSEIHERIVDVLFGALSQFVPDRVMASSGGTSCNFLSGGVHPDTNKYWAYYHIEGCGWGGQERQDGNNSQCPINGNCRNTPIEVLETKYPYRVREYNLVTDSGGAGKRRGGLASRRILEVTAPEITVSAMIDRMEVKPFGLFGGKEATSTGLYIKRAGDTDFRTFSEVFGTVSPNKFSGIRVHKGDQILIQSAGGGGFESPQLREPEAVLKDVEDGFVSVNNAFKEYGVEIEEENGKYVIKGLHRESTPNRTAESVKSERAICKINDAVSEKSGKWVERASALYETEGITCDVCGKIMPRKYWMVNYNDAVMKFCDSDCQNMYEIYWKPRYEMRQT